MIVSASALSYEAPALPRDRSMPASARRRWIGQSRRRESPRWKSTSRARRSHESCHLRPSRHQGAGREPVARDPGEGGRYGYCRCPKWPGVIVRRGAVEADFARACLIAASEAGVPRLLKAILLDAGHEKLAACASLRQKADRHVAGFRDQRSFLIEQFGGGSSRTMPGRPARTVHDADASDGRSRPLASFSALESPHVGFNDASAFSGLRPRQQPRYIASDRATCRPSHERQFRGSFGVPPKPTAPPS
jgi:hypothetical protein